MNVERFRLFLEIWNNCEVKNYFHFIGTEEEHVFLLNDGTEVIVKELKE